MKKTISKRKNPPANIFVVSWGEYEDDTDNLSSGTFNDIYTTKKKAVDEVWNAMLNCMLGSLSANDKSEWKELYGSDNPDEILHKCVKVSYDETYFEYTDPVYSTRCNYTIVKYAVKYAV